MGWAIPTGVRTRITDCLDKPSNTMAHLLIIELPGGNDFDLVQAAVDRGDRFTFLTSDLHHYQTQNAAWALLEQAQQLLEIPDFAFDPVSQAVL